MSDIPDAARRAVKQRSQSRCEVCGIGPMEAIHHRQRRREGGHGIWNLLGVDNVCHSRIHAHPKWAHANGWIISVFDEEAPQVPVLIRGRQTMLTDDGRYSELA